MYIAQVIKSCYKKKSAGKLSSSDKIDKIVTNRWLGLPIFAVVMFLAGTCSALAPPLITMQLTNTLPQATRSAATMSLTPKPKTSMLTRLWLR